MKEHTRTIKDTLKTVVQIRVKKELSSNPHMGYLLSAELKTKPYLNSRLSTMEALTVKFVTKLKVLLYVLSLFTSQDIFAELNLVLTT